MGLDPNDLNLHISAEVSAPGAEQAAQQIRGAGQAADQTRNSFDRLRQAGAVANPVAQVAAPPVNPANTGGRDPQLANELVRQLVQQRQATEEVFKNAVESVRQSTGIRPTITPQALGINPAPAVQAASSAVRAPQRPRAQTAEDDDGGGIGVSATTLVRAAAGLAGIGLGINIVAGAARLAHDAVAGLVDSQVEWERSLRETTGLYGILAPRAEAVARAQASAAGVVGSEQDFLQANLQARFLTTRFGVPESQVNQLVLAAGRTAGAEGLNPEQARALQAQTLAAVESGGNQLRDRGVFLDPESVARQIGLPSGAALAALTPSQMDQAKAAIATIGLNQYSDAARQRGAALLDARTAAQQALEQGRAQLQNQFEGGVLNPSSLVAPLEGGGYGSAAARENAPDLVALQRQVDQADAAVQKFQSDLGTSADAVRQATEALAKLGVEADSSAARLLSFTGSLEDPYSRARGDIGSQAQAAVAARAVGPNPLAFQSAAENATQAQQQASAEARRAYDSVDAQRALQRDDANRDYLQRLANQQGPGLEDQRSRAQAALADADRRTEADLTVRRGQQAQALAQRASASAQAGVSTIDLVDQQRQLDAAGDLANLRAETLNREGNIVDLQRQEADLADRMAVAGRENLDLLRQQTQARLDSLGASNRLNDLQYAQQHDTLAIQAVRADVRRGALDPSALAQIPDLRQRVRAEALATPRAQLNALEAQRPAELASRGVQQDQLQVALRQIPLTQQQRGLEDQLTPLQQQQRGTDERTQGINRELELARLAEEPQRTAAERNVLAASAVALAADQSVRSAQEWAANIHDGLTDLERAWQLTGGVVPAPGARSATADTAGQAVIAAGGSVQDASAAAGRAYADPTGGGGDRITINVTVGGSSASGDEIARSVLAALNSRGTRAPRAAPRSLVGAR